MKNSSRINTYWKLTLKLFMRKATVLRLYVESVAKLSEVSMLFNNTSKVSTLTWASNVQSAMLRRKTHIPWGDISEAATVTERNARSVRNLSHKRFSCENTSVMSTTSWNLSIVKAVRSSAPVWTISICTGESPTADWTRWPKHCCSPWWRMINIRSILEMI